MFILQINVGLVELNNEHNELKIKRASSLPISVRKSATDVTVRSVAVEKHLAPKHNELKIKRASSLPISVRKSATDVTVRSVAVEKHLAHNKSLRVETNELKRPNGFSCIPIWRLYVTSQAQESVFLLKSTKSPPGSHTTISICICAEGETMKVINFFFLSHK